MGFLKIFQKDRKLKKIQFFEFDDALFSMFKEEEENNGGFIDIYEVVGNFYKKEITKMDNQELKPLI